MKQQKLRLKYRRPVWSGYGSNSLPPRTGRKPRVILEITPEVLEKIERHAQQGLNRQQIAHVLNISRSTLDRRSRDIEAIDLAIKKGRDRGIARVTHTLYEQALNPRSVADRIFWLKNNAGYRDAQSFEHSGPGGGPMESTVRKEYNDQERAAKVASIFGRVQARIGDKIKLKGKR